MRDRDGAHDPRWRQTSDAFAFAVDDAVDDGEVVNVENDAKEVAADEDDDDAEEDRRQVEIRVEMTLRKFRRRRRTGGGRHDRGHGRRCRRMRS